MVTGPFEMPVNVPELSIVAIVVDEETHGLFIVGVPEPVNGIIEPAHKELGPVIVGVALTTIVVIAESVPHCEFPDFNFML